MSQWVSIDAFFKQAESKQETPTQRALREAAEKDVIPKGERCWVTGCRSLKYFQNPSNLASHLRIAHPDTWERMKTFPGTY